MKEPKTAPVARHRPLVMMVEDDPDDVQIYGSILCYNGFDVLLVPDGGSAIRAAELHRPDLVLLDLGLPDWEGLDLCRELSGLLTKTVPIIALSGYPENVIGSRAREAGCVSFFEKPTSPLRVLARIEELLGRPPAAGEGQGPEIISYV